MEGKSASVHDRTNTEGMCNLDFRVGDIVEILPDIVFSSMMEQYKMSVTPFCITRSRVSFAYMGITRLYRK